MAEDAAQPGPDGHRCPSCGGRLPDPVLIAAANLARMLLPVEEEIHFCPGPILLKPSA